MMDILDWLDAHDREDIRREKLERIYNDPDIWDRKWDEMKEEEILNERKVKKGI